MPVPSSGLSAVGWFDDVVRPRKTDSSVYYGDLPVIPQIVPGCRGRPPQQTGGKGPDDPHPRGSQPLRIILQKNL
ncbi:hypothetical protein MASR1M66_20930 [Aminivibrio sp.]